MSFLDNLRKIFGSGGTRAGEADVYWVYAQCQRCGEPLKGRVNLRNEPSLTDDGETWIVRKGLVGSERRCFQTVEVTLTFDAQKRRVLESEVSGGKIITEEEYRARQRQAVYLPVEHNE